MVNNFQAMENYNRNRACSYLLNKIDEEEPYNRNSCITKEQCRHLFMNSTQWNKEKANSLSFHLSFFELHFKYYTNLHDDILKKDKYYVYWLLQKIFQKYTNSRWKQFSSYVMSFGYVSCNPLSAKHISEYYSHFFDSKKSKYYNFLKKIVEKFPLKGITLNHVLSYYKNYKNDPIKFESFANNNKYEPGKLPPKFDKKTHKRIKQDPIIWICELDSGL